MNKFIYKCDYCGEGFETKEKVVHHEFHCKQKPVKIRGKIKPIFDLAQGIKLGIGFGIGLTISSIITFLVIIAVFGAGIAGLISQIF